MFITYIFVYYLCVFVCYLLCIRMHSVNVCYVWVHVRV